MSLPKLGNKEWWMRREYKGNAAQVVRAVIATIMLLHLLYLGGVLTRLATAFNWKWLVLPPQAFLAIHIGLIAVVAFLLIRQRGILRETDSHGMICY